MTSGSLTTLKSTAASIGLHVLFLAAGSALVYQNSIHTLELTGASGGGSMISLSDFSVGAKKGPVRNVVPAKDVINSSTSDQFTKTVSSAPATGQESGTSTSTSSIGVGSTNGAEASGGGAGSGTGIGSGSGAGDTDNGLLFSQIKSFFETRLGSTLKIRETQLIKIKVFINSDGEVTDASLAQGNLEGSLLRRVLSVAKNLPFKNYWKSGSFPKELIFPIVLTPQ